MPPPRTQEGPPSKFVVFDDFSGGMNTQAARQGLNEKQAAWMENLQPVAANELLGVPSALAALATLTGETVVKFFYFDVGIGTDQIIAFTAAGTGYAIGNPTGVVKVIAPAGTFSATGPDAVAYQASRLLIADVTAGYCTWDGTLFVQQGGVSPNFAIQTSGSGYTSGGTAAISGGSGSGATVTPVFAGGALVGMVLTNPGTGYKASDSITVTITAIGAGSGATVNGHVWPFITTPITTIAFAFGRVWIAGKRTLICTGTGSSTYGAAYDDFLTADASVTTTIGDADLIHQITVLRFLNGALYIIGDNSVKSISSISVSSGVTNFTITPLSSDQGTIYPQTVLSFNRLVLFANRVGVFAVFGASVEKISDPMDGIFRKIDFTQALSAAINDLNNIHTYLLLVRYQDPNGTRSLILAFAGKRWFVIGQGNGLVALLTAVLVSTGLSTTFGSSGADVTQLLSGTSPVNYKLSTSLTTRNNPVEDKRIIRAGVGQTTNAPSDLKLVIESENGSADTQIISPTGILQFTNASGGNLAFSNSSGGTLAFSGVAFNLSHSAAASVTGRYIGATVTGSLNGIALQPVILEYADAALWGKG